jgi:hypothetical protein
MSPRKQLGVSAAVVMAAVVTVFASGTDHWPVAAAAAVAGLPAVGGFLAAWRRVFPSVAQSLAPWRSARTLADLGELTAQWLEGTIPAEPGYCGGPDEETVPLVPVLATLNRAGFVTTGSQPAFDGEGYDGARWQQRAAVDAFASAGVALAVTLAARQAGLIVVAHDPAELPRWRCRRARSVDVTRRYDRVVTGFGVHLSRQFIEDCWTGWGACHPDGTDALCRAWQVTIADPEWGRPDLLWRVLFAAVASSPRGVA